MEIKELLEMQKKLDNAILKKQVEPLTSSIEQQKYLYEKLNGDLLTERILALSVEVGELANATRCFKYWSLKDSEPVERVLDEYADCLHFMLSIAHSLNFTAEEIEEAYKQKNKVNYERIKNGY